MEPFTQWGERLPASTPKPEPTGPGMVVHALYDVSMYRDTPELTRYLRADDDDQAHADALADMPNAIVQFYELSEGESFFEDVR